MLPLDTDHPQDANPYRAPQAISTDNLPSETDRGLNLNGGSENLLKQALVTVILMAVFPTCIFAFFAGLGIPFVITGLSVNHSLTIYILSAISGLLTSVLTWVALLKFLNWYIDLTPYQAPVQWRDLHQAANSSNVHQEDERHQSE